MSSKLWNNPFQQPTNNHTFRTYWTH